MFIIYDNDYSEKNMALLVDYFSTKCIVRSWQYISKLSKTEKAES